MIKSTAGVSVCLFALEEGGQPGGVIIAPSSRVPTVQGCPQGGCRDPSWNCGLIACPAGIQERSWSLSGSCQLSRTAVEHGQRKSQKGTLLPLQQITFPSMLQL